MSFQPSNAATMTGSTSSGTPSSSITQRLLPTCPRVRPNLTACAGSARSPLVWGSDRITAPFVTPEHPTAVRAVPGQLPRRARTLFRGGALRRTIDRGRMSKPSPGPASRSGGAGRRRRSAGHNVERSHCSTLAMCTVAQERAASVSRSRSALRMARCSWRVRLTASSWVRPRQIRARVVGPDRPSRRSRAPSCRRTGRCPGGTPGRRRRVPPPRARRRARSAGRRGRPVAAR